MVGTVDTQGLLALADKLSDGILVHRDGEILYINEVTYRMLHYATAEELIGRPIQQLLHPGAQARVVGRILEESQSSHRLNLCCQGGEVVAAEVRGFPILFEGMPCVLSLIRAVPDAQRQAEQAQELNRLISVNATINASLQDVNNPLSYVITNLAFVLAEVEELKRLMTQVVPEWTERMEEVLEAMKETEEGVQKIRSRLGELGSLRRESDERRERLEVREVVEEAIRQVRGEFPLQWEPERDYQETPPVEASRIRLTQALVNVLRNAVEAIPDIPQGSNWLRIHTYTAEDGAAIVDIDDSGRGVGPINPERVFEPFFTTKVGAAGLGLSVTRGILKAMGGEIALSPLPQGTRARLTMPPYRRKGDRDVARGAKVLVIDDEEKVCTALRRVLGPNHQTTVMTDPRKALESFRQGARYDLVFCDLRMPGLSGQELYREIQVVAPEQAERIVFMTADSERQSNQQFLVGITNLYIEKPFDTQRVRELALYAIR